MAANNNKNSLLASQARELFTEHAGRVLPQLTRAITDKLSALVNEPGSGPEMQERRDAWMAFQANGASWGAATGKAWKKVQEIPQNSNSLRSMLETGRFELMGNEVMENKILASRLALRLLDIASWELNDLRLRIQSLEHVSELPKGDILRPEVLSEKLVEQWMATPLSRELWVMVQDLIQARLAEHLLEAYHNANEFLVQNGVMAEIDLRPLVKRTPSAVTGAQVPDSTSSARLNPPGPQGRASLTGSGSPSRRRSGADADGQDFPHEETRMQTATTPLARARMRAQGVMGHLKRMLSNEVAGFDDTRATQASPQLAQAMAGMAGAPYAAAGGATVLSGTAEQVYGAGHVEQAAGALRQQTSTLKRAASTSSEKATIEIVALMFQSILAEDRIPPTIRVWFARLQMPVLRVAIAEPEFFGSLQHPARRLIDRMGSCVLGFDAGVTGGALEIEIKRVVQVIEQYPETGRRVFQLVYDEFQKFLSKFLSEQGSAARVVTIAQQVEQKETMAIQYTIEMRNMLNDMPVREEIREFLFKVWAEVLAIAAMRNGPQHGETVALKRAAADLVWAASAKPNRIDRAKVIADLPKLLQLLRLGMSMLGLDAQAQDAHIKVISDTLADAFLSKTDSISSERIEAMAKRLANLEDYLSDEDIGDLPLDTESLVMMIGIDAADIEVITDGGSQPTEAMRAWAQELQLGSWFTLDHNGKVSHVQFAWRSDRQQLHLFASADGRNFLIQARRLAAYLQAGLLVPTEEEALTVRATRDALAKLDANPERLLG
ncbi:MAG: hypothetical protein JWQ72_92 [Polaromonas sp.]|nr:hypothetical protein [Polaromonas sp.]